MPYVITDSCIGCTACVPLCPAEAITGQSSRLHVIDPHICLDCGACGRICPVRAVLDDDMRRCKPLERVDWPLPVFDDAACVACDACIIACPPGCLDLELRMHRGTSLRGLPVLSQPENCISCGFCMQACLYGAVELRPSGMNSE